MCHWRQKWLCASPSCCDTRELTDNEATPAGLVAWFVLLAASGTLSWRRFQWEEGRPGFSLALLCWSPLCLGEANRCKSSWRTEERIYILAISCHSETRTKECPAWVWPCSTSRQRFMNLDQVMQHSHCVCNLGFAGRDCEHTWKRV